MKNFEIFVVSVLLFAAVVCESKLHKSKGARLHGGNPAELGQFPYTVGIKSGSIIENPVCSGVIVGPRHILTEAWCTTEIAELTVIAGCLEWNGEDCTVYNMENITVHPDYAGSWHNDLAIIQVSPDIVITDLVQIIFVSESRVQNASELLISGWSSWTTSDLTWYDVMAVDDETCQNRWSFADDTFVCTTPGHMVAGGDWGTPLVENGELVAITIMSGTYDIHLRVETFVDWMASIILAE